jgi:hypothetical protein
MKAPGSVRRDMRWLDPAEHPVIEIGTDAEVAKVPPRGADLTPGPVRSSQSGSALLPIWMIAGPEPKDRMARRLGDEVIERRVGFDVEERPDDRHALEVPLQDGRRLLGCDLLDVQLLGASGAADLDLARGARVAYPADLAVGRDEPALAVLDEQHRG